MNTEHEQSPETSRHTVPTTAVVRFQETSTNDCYFVVYEPNRKHFGMLNKEIDGFFYFAPQGSGGLWPSNVMREIADKLDELNYLWEQQVAKDCGI